MINNILAKRWFKYYISIIVSVLSLIFVFNYLIDPYGRQNFFCDIKYKPVLNERGKKFHYIFNEGNINKYNSIILGSSRVMKLTPSASPYTEDFYNFGVHVANNSEKLFILEKWIKEKKLKKVYLGIDYYNFHKNKNPLDVNIKKFTNGYNPNFLSLQTLNLSYKSFINMINKKPITFFNEDGSINYYNKDFLISSHKYDFSLSHFKEQSLEHLNNNMINDDFEIEEKVFDVLKKIKELSLIYDFQLYVFITPMNNTFLDLVKQHQDILVQFNYIDRKLLKIFGKIYKFNLNDSYNANRENFYDPFHYRDFLGTEIINRLNAHGNYGAILYNKEELNAL